MFHNGRIYLPNLNIDVPKLDRDYGLEIFETKFIINSVKEVQNYENEDFYLILN